MTERGRNIAVGVTVIVALSLLAGMILIFAGLPEKFQRGYDLQIVSDGTHGVNEGDLVYMAGIRIGRVTHIGYTDNDPRKGVTLTVRIEHTVRLPANVEAYVFGGSGLSGAYVELKAQGPYRTDPATGRPLDFLPATGGYVLKANVRSSSLIPEEVTDALKGLSTLADNINKLIAPPPAAATGSQPTTGQTQTAAMTAPADQGLQGTVAKLNRTLDAIYAVTGDQQNQTNLKTSMANLSKASASAIEAMDALKTFAASATKTADNASALTTRASDDIHSLTQKLITDAEAISKMMASLNQTADKMNSGEGTMGKLLNDPALYNGLVEMSQSVNTLVKDFDDLAKKWKERGIEMKLK